MRPDLSPMVGWETGRASEPSFMDMNLNSVRSRSEPQVVLYQYDITDPMNPLGLLMAYAEKSVKPVVSDFDTFLVGSHGIQYDPLPPEQLKLMAWCLEHTKAILHKKGRDASWTSRWLQVLKAEAENGFYPKIPKYGFGDATSYRIVNDIIDVTSSCGAVRHGAECFNYYFPQELDDEYLVIWEGFCNPAWAYMTEPELREFLVERVAEGYIFPLNPVWAVRDPEWYPVFQALRNSSAAQTSLTCWFPPAIMEMIDSLHADVPGGYVESQPLLKSSQSICTNAMDLRGSDICSFAEAQVRRVYKKRWARIFKSIVRFADALRSENAKLEPGRG